MRTGVTDLKLHPGHAPQWLTKRMKELSQQIFKILVEDHGQKEVLKRLGNPFWFQCLSHVLGFDWNSSGTTTVTCGILKDVLGEEFGIEVAGGKGKTSLKTPEEIKAKGRKLSLKWSETKEIVKASKLGAKVDNTALQDNFNLYHHVMFFSEGGDWTIVQQGMRSETKKARRYHWTSFGTDEFIKNREEEIIGQEFVDRALNLVSDRSEKVRNISKDLIKERPSKLKNKFKKIKGFKTGLYRFTKDVKTKYLSVIPQRMNWEAVRKAYEFQPSDYQELISIKGIGPATVRALALISQLMYGEEADWKDPMKYAFTVGGKDGVPFPVERKTMDKTTEILKQAIQGSEIDKKTKKKAVKRLKTLVPKSPRKS